MNSNDQHTDSRSSSGVSGSTDRGRPATMTALVQTGFGMPHDVLAPTTVDRPVCGPGEVLVRVKASSVNTPDWAAVIGLPYVMRLHFGIRRPAAPIGGTDLSGVVEEVGGGVNDFAPGDEVFGSAWHKRLGPRPGTFAQYTVAPVDQLVHKPASVSFEEAAAVVMSGVTAMTAIEEVAAVSPGQRLLINGASGGIGTLAVQMAKARGAIVTGVCSGRNAELVRSLGADEVIDYTERDFTTEPAGYDAILDNVLNHRPSALARVLADDGLLMPNSIGDTDHKLLAGIPRMAQAALLRFRGVRLGFVPFKMGAAALTGLADRLDSGQLTVPIDSVHRLADGADAIERMRTRRAQGNLVIVP